MEVYSTMSEQSKKTKKGKLWVGCICGKHEPKANSDCCWDNIRTPKYISRAYWVCKVCGKDVSLMYVLYVEAMENQKKLLNKKGRNSKNIKKKK